MNISSNQSVLEIFDRWQAEDQALKSCINQIRQWMLEIEMYGIPRFGEAATRLRSVHQRLIEHFCSEDEMILELTLVQPTSVGPLDQLSRLSTDEHEDILDRIGVLMERLNRLEPPYESWQQALQEFEQIVGLIEDHETLETERVLALIPSEIDSAESLD